ncbi:MAG: hypothetical protein ACD_87C00160G0001 [uncultured bacterium]|nr:MAG: hypothetical protein ACD_87C00160G0001 [uncultured bacterium]
MNGKMHEILPGITFHMFHKALFTAPVQRFTDGLESRDIGVILRAVGQGCGSLQGSPMVKDPGNMADSRRLFRETQDEIVILAAFEADPETTDFPDQFRPIDAQMTGVHVGQERVRRPVRLEEGGMPLPLFIDLVLVAVDHVRIGMTVQQDRVFVEGIHGKFVVVIEQGDKFPAHHIQRRVGAG